MQEKIAGANYILTFYSDVENLNKYCAGYKNLLIELKEKYPNNQKMEFNDIQRIKEITNYLRYLVIAIDLKLKALGNKISVFKEKINGNEYNESYEKITESIVPDFKQIMQHATIINELFVNGIAEEILTQSSKLYEEFYGATANN